MRKNSSEHGGALLLVIVVTLVIIGISAAFLSFSAINSRKTSIDMMGLQALYIAETGAGMFVNQVNSKPISGAPPSPQSLVTGKPSGMAGGDYVYPTSGFVDFGANKIDDDGNGTADDEFEQNFIRFQVEGTYAGVTRKLEILLSRPAGGVYWNAVFAGNSSLTSGYNLGFDGVAKGSGDLVRGDIYTGGNFQGKGTSEFQNETGGPNPTIMFKDTNLGGPGGPNYQQGTQADLLIPRDLLTGKTTYQALAEKYRKTGTNGTLREENGVKYFDVAWDLQNMGGTSGGKNNGGAQIDQSPGSNGGLGRAQEQILNPNEPSHIFRKNPTEPGNNNDRTTSYAYVDTFKDDYYIEDPTHKGVNNISNLGYAINGDTKADGVYISPNGSDAVYYVDGNLWVSHNTMKSYQWIKPSSMKNMKVTIVVNGNVNFTDNLVYQQYQSDTDALAILALKDTSRPNAVGANFVNSTSVLPGTTKTVSQFVTEFNKRAAAAGNDSSGQRKIPDLDLTTGPGRDRAASEFNRAFGSGNVFYGDPGSGTVEYFEAFMYAENNFYATNLDSTKSSGGTQRVEIFGNMTAGNHVSIMRDTAKAGYIPLKVTFDDRIKTPGGVRPPALPSTPGFGSGDWQIASWKQIP